MTPVTPSQGARKACVLPISSSKSFNPITDADLINLITARRLMRHAAKIACDTQQEIDGRIRGGASIQSTRYEYDPTSGDIQQRGRS